MHIDNVIFLILSKNAYTKFSAGPKLLDAYVHYFNNRRPAAVLGYKSPVQYKTKLGF